MKGGHQCFYINISKYIFILIYIYILFCVFLKERSFWMISRDKAFSFLLLSACESFIDVLSKNKSSHTHVLISNTHWGNNELFTVFIWKVTGQCVSFFLFLFFFMNSKVMSIAANQLALVSPPFHTSKFMPVERCYLFQLTAIKKVTCTCGYEMQFRKSFPPNVSCY